MLLLPVMTTYFVSLKTNAILDKLSDDQLSVKDQERISIIPSLTGYCLEDFYMSRL